ncbi:MULTISPECIES: UDP-glucuronic acid decarboxylase family protein [Thermomicrobium]|uniref:UDP-glucuronate decarboxylase n=1 Tax=Thermomicrobium roseum (strain ATCC 27502 / DSM 5159 / P-2) TaxID=309801 RepID=B9KZC6_THERP|nr:MULTISPECIES: UDP-glucuronic acid decarboxylase family protein [Thermomicrobium]ACM06334.1 UDP-glucuronate decarboxylase [Thermomicrobium roseum DSM 5159]MBO9305937.1 SDR family oxidoreductase [Thermomicrobium sp.]
MRILVTGGAGFIGSHLCESLLLDGYQVIAVDSLLTGRLGNIRHLLTHPFFRFIEQDVTQGIDIEADAIFHLASPASPVGYRQYPIETLLVNSVGTYHLLELARRVRARFVFASTSEVYGDPLIHPQREDYFGNVNPIGPRSCYDEGKRFGEALTMEFVRSFGVDARIARIFNTYGPRMDPADGRVVPNFIVHALTGEPIEIFGDGMQTRSLCYISDMVRGLRLLMERDGLAGTVINLGNPDERTILELAYLVRELTGNPVPIVFRPARPDDPGRRCPDISRARAVLGWEPRVPVEEGLRMTIDYFQDVLARAAAFDE